MADQDPIPASDPAPATPADETSDELASSLASVWARYTGARPTGCALDFDGRVVRWTLPDGLEALTEGIDAGGEAGAPPLTLTGYRRATSTAVTKVTHRRVSARMCKEDKATGAATETFILEALTRKY